MSKLPMAIVLLRTVFDEHAGKQGDPKTLTKKEVCDLFKNELLIDVSDKDEADKMFNMLDEDGDGVVNFTEFGSLVLAFCESCHLE